MERSYHKFFYILVIFNTLWLTKGASILPLQSAPSRIVGGTPAIETEYPHQVSLRYYNQHRCGGSIISSSYILTAAHCVSGTHPDSLSILAGTTVLSFPQSTAQLRSVSKFIIHSKYTPLGNDYDIAIIRLARPLELNNAVNSIAIPNFGFEVSSSAYTATTTGWGITDSGSSSDFLMSVTVPIVPHRLCEDSYILSLDDSLIRDSMICAGKVGKDSCQGDSGGPLTIDYGYLNNGKPYRLLIGVTAFGEGCGKEGYPGVYSKVATYRDWIAANTGL